VRLLHVLAALFLRILWESFYSRNQILLVSGHNIIYKNKAKSDTETYDENSGSCVRVY